MYLVLIAGVSLIAVGLPLSVWLHARGAANAVAATAGDAALAGMVLTVVAAVLIVAIAFPRWLVDRVPALARMRPTVGFGLGGALINLALTIVFVVAALVAGPMSGFTSVASIGAALSFLLLLAAAAVVAFGAVVEPLSRRAGAAVSGGTESD